MDIMSKEPNRFSGLTISGKEEGNSHKRAQKAQEYFVVPFVANPSFTRCNQSLLEFLHCGREPRHANDGSLRDAGRNNRGNTAGQVQP